VFDRVVVEGWQGVMSESCAEAAGAPLRPLVVVTAMDEEGDALGHAISDAPWMVDRSIQIKTGPFGDRELVVAVCGMGKVAAAVAAQYLIDRFRPAVLLNVGLAGALYDDPSVGDLVVVDGTIQHDFDARPFVPERSLLPHLGLARFHADDELVEIAQRACVASEEAPLTGPTPRRLRGLALTGDQVVTSAVAKRTLRSVYPDALVVDMETAAIAQTALQNATPWAAVRMVSDSADESLDASEVLAYCQTVGTTTLRGVVLRMVEQLSAKGI
jgi:adenosylhomocysteine nucleosidase